ncbi:MAG: hypothetical protein Q9225_006623 [Loekoesia sp. 1 TL-2023]
MTYGPKAMELKAPSFLPFQRRDAYEPSDLKAYLKLQQLRCVRSDSADANLKDPLCSHCKEMLNLNPDLSIVLDSLKVSSEPDLPWIPGFPKKKPSKSPTPTKYSPIRLPTIEEISVENNIDIAQDVDLGTLALQTPAKRRKIDHQAPYTSNAQISGSPTLDQFQWTPIAQRKEDIINTFDNEIIPEEDSDDDGDVAETQAESASPKPRSAIREKKDRLLDWERRAKRTSSDFTNDEFEFRERGPSFQEFLEEEKRVRKKARYDF